MTIARNLLKVGAVVGSIPVAGFVVGYQIRANQFLSSNSGEHRVYKVSEIPLYNTNNDAYVSHVAEIYPRNAFESQIGSVRLTVQEVVNTIVESYRVVEDKFNIGVSHFQATIDYIQNENSHEVARIGTITVAGLLGLVLGYKRSTSRKVLYATIAGSSMASLCYPKQTVNLSQNLYQGTCSLYNQLTSPAEEPEPVQVEVVNEVQVEAVNEVHEVDNIELDTSEEISKDTESVLVEKVKILKGDPGQSNPEDQDMYSTRSS